MKNGKTRRRPSSRRRRRQSSVVVRRRGRPSSSVVVRRRRPSTSSSVVCQISFLLFAEIVGYKSSGPTEVGNHKTIEQAIKVAGPHSTGQ